jgi:hypothetical protein
MKKRIMLPEPVGIPERIYSSELDETNSRTYLEEWLKEVYKEVKPKLNDELIMRYGLFEYKMSISIDGDNNMDGTARFPLLREEFKDKMLNLAIRKLGWFILGTARRIPMGIENKLTGVFEVNGYRDYVMNEVID